MFGSTRSEGQIAYYKKHLNKWLLVGLSLMILGEVVGIAFTLMNTEGGEIDDEDYEDMHDEDMHGRNDTVAPDAEAKVHKHNVSSVALIARIFSILCMLSFMLPFLYFYVTVDSEKIIMKLSCCKDSVLINNIKNIKMDQRCACYNGGFAQYQECKFTEMTFGVGVSKHMARIDVKKMHYFCRKPARTLLIEMADAQDGQAFMRAVADVRGNLPVAGDTDDF